MIAHGARQGTVPLIMDKTANRPALWTVLGFLCTRGHHLHISIREKQKAVIYLSINSAFSIATDL